MSNLTLLCGLTLATVMVGSVSCSDEDGDSPGGGATIAVGNEPPAEAIEVVMPPGELPKQKVGEMPGGDFLPAVKCGERVCPDEAPHCVWQRGHWLCMP